MPAKPRAMLITGTPRSATTWVGRVIAASPQVLFVNEPFNPNVHQGVVGHRIGLPAWFTRLDETNADQHQRRLDRIYKTWWRPITPRKELAGIRGLRSATSFGVRAARAKLRGGAPLYKDPIALLSADYLADRYDLAVVVMMRHPLSFVGSMKRRDWAFDFRNFADQPAVIDGVLSGFADTIRRECQEPSSIVVRSALLWKMLMHVVGNYRSVHPGWQFVRAEDMAADPAKHITEIRQLAGLPDDEAIDAAINEMASDRNPVDVENGEMWWKRNVSEVGDLWKERLTPEEINTIRDLTDPEWRSFYDENTWA